MTEEEILAKVPVNWLDNYQSELDSMIQLIANRFTLIVAEDLKVDPDNTEEFWPALANKTNDTVIDAKLKFARVCMENARLEIFRQHYGNLLQVNSKQQMVIPPALVDRIMGEEK